MSPVKSPEKVSATKNGKEDKIVAEKAESEELPSGWMIEVKTRKGSSGKKVDRYYTDPVTKYTFRSLKEVHRYLKTGHLGRLAIKPKDDNDVNIDSETKSGEPENGSEGHRKRTKSGEKSQLELTQGASKRLATVKPDAPPLPSPPERKTRQGTRLAEIKNDAPLSPPERTTRQGTKLAGIKTDAPSSSELKTRQGTKLAGIKTDAPSPSELKTRQATKLAGIKTDAPSPSELKTRQATKLAGIKTEAPSPLELKTRQPTQLAGIKTDASSPSELKTRQATKLAGVKTDAPSPSDLKTRQAMKVAGIKNDVPSLPELKAGQATKLAGIKTDAPSLVVAKTRQAKRLAGTEVDATPPSPPEPKTCRQAAARLEKEVESGTTVNLATQKVSNKKAKEEKSNADMDIIPNPEQKISIPSTPVTQEICKDDITVNEKQESHTVLPPVTHSTAEPQPPPAAAPASSTFDPPVNNPIDIKPESPVNFSLNDLWTDPCIEFAVKTLTGAIPFGELNKSSDFPASSPLEVPMGGLWTDPCIEFAVKTLTGAIPVSGDLSVQDYLQNQPTCSLPDVGMNSFCQTEVLSKHFENSNSNKLGEATVRNGGLEKSAVPQQVKGGANIGQCSRGRFYQ